MHRTAGDITIVTTEILVAEDVGPEEDRILVLTVRKNQLMMSRRNLTQEINRNRMTTRTGHAVGDRMADHLPHGPGAVAVPHLNGMSQGISLRKGRVMNREKSLVKEKKEGDLLAAGADPDTDADPIKTPLKARNRANTVNKENKWNEVVKRRVETSVHLTTVAAVVRFTAGILDALAERTGSEERKTMNLRPVMKKPAKPTAPRLSNQLTTNEETRQL